MLEMLLERMKKLGYGEDLDAAKFSEIIKDGPKSTEFTKLVAALAEELAAFCDLDEAIHPISSPDDSSSFLLELSCFLKELDTWSDKLITGNVNERLASEEDKYNLILFLVSEIATCRLVEAKSDDESCPMEVDGESEIAKDLKDMLMALDFEKPPENITAELLFARLEEKLGKELKELPPELLGLPLLTEELDEAQWEIFAQIHEEYRAEYTKRCQMLLQRLDVTIQSLLWSTQIENRKAELEETYMVTRSLLNAEPDVTVPHLLAAREDAAIMEKTSSASVRQNTRSEINSIIIGDVPDRGGRPYEQQPPPPEMPSWQKERVAGPSHFSGGRGGGGGGGGGRGGGFRGSRGGAGRGGGGGGANFGGESSGFQGPSTSFSSEGGFSGGYGGRYGGGSAGGFASGPAASYGGGSGGPSTSFGGGSVASAPTFGEGSSGPSTSFGGGSVPSALAFGGGLGGSTTSFGGSSVAHAPAFGGGSGRLLPAFGGGSNRTAPAFEGGSGGADPAFGGGSGGSAPSFGGVSGGQVASFGGGSGAPAVSFEGGSGGAFGGMSGGGFGEVSGGAFGGGMAAGAGSLGGFGGGFSGYGEGSGGQANMNYGGGYKGKGSGNSGDNRGGGNGSGAGNKGGGGFREHKDAKPNACHHVDYHQSQYSGYGHRYCYPSSVGCVPPPQDDTNTGQQFQREGGGNNRRRGGRVQGGWNQGRGNRGGNKFQRGGYNRGRS